MNRSKTFFMVALVALVVACNTERPLSSPEAIRASVQTLGPSTKAEPKTFFFKNADGTWRSLRYTGSCGWAIIRKDTASTSSWWWQTDTACVSPATLSNTSLQGDATTTNKYYQTGRTRFEITTNDGHGQVTWILDQAQPQNNDYINLNWHNTDCSYTFGIRARGVETYLNQASIFADDGNFKFAPLIPSPTNVVLSAAGPYAKITWTNANPADSTEVWFGDTGFPAYQATALPGVSTYFIPWFSGSHQYISKVRHVGLGNECGVGEFTYSNQLTH